MVNDYDRLMFLRTSKKYLIFTFKVDRYGNNDYNKLFVTNN